MYGYLGVHFGRYSRTVQEGGQNAFCRTQKEHDVKERTIGKPYYA